MENVRLSNPRNPPSQLGQLISVVIVLIYLFTCRLPYSPPPPVNSRKAGPLPLLHRALLGRRRQGPDKYLYNKWRSQSWAQNCHTKEAAETDEALEKTAINPVAKALQTAQISILNEVCFFSNDLNVARFEAWPCHLQAMWPWAGSVPVPEEDPPP